MTFTRASWAFVVAAASASAAHAQTAIHVSSLAELRQHAGASDATVKLAPGVYNLSGDTDGDGAGDSRIFLNLTGSNTTFDFTEVEFRVSTRDLRGYGSGNANGVNLLGVFGSNLTVQGFQLTTYQPGATAYWSDSETISVKIGGANNTVRDARITTAGSTPYGYGDAFGKGTNPDPGNVPFISHRKASGILIREGSGATIEGVDLQMRSFGHGIYLQRARDIRILNSTITGELASSNAVIDHPLYDDYVDPDTGLPGVTVYRQPIPAGIKISKSEDGVRAYGVDPDGVGVENVHVENVVVRNMREAFSLFAADGTKTILNSEAWGNETGFEPGSDTTIVDSRGDATNGPLLFFRRSGIADAKVELQLVQDMPQVGHWDIAYISGSNTDVTLTGNARGALPDDALIRVAQRWNDWRHQEGPLESGYSTSGLSFINTSGQDVVIGTPAMTSGRYHVNSGDVLGGGETISTSQGQGIRVDAGGALDPRGWLRFALADGVLDLSRAVAGTQTGALRFALGDSSTSDTIDVLGGLDIGSGVLGLGDFAFDLGPGFASGSYVLFSSDRPIAGSFAADTTAVLGGREVVLTLGADRRSIALVALPEPATAALPAILLFYAAAGRRRQSELQTLYETP